MRTSGEKAGGDSVVLWSDVRVGHPIWRQQCRQPFGEPNAHDLVGGVELYDVDRNRPGKDEGRVR
jgi:hypothetical protein